MTATPKSPRPDRPNLAGRRHVYGRRHGHRLRPGQKKLIEALLPRLRVTAGDPGLKTPHVLFARPVREVWLEIGFGSGEHLAAQAAAHPDIGFIGCEPFINGVARLLSQVDEAGLGAVRIHDGDARDLLEALGEASVTRVFLLFPDPWPKTRHAKRRFVSADTLGHIARILADGGVFRLASDIGGYVDRSLRLIRRHGAFDWPAGRAADWRRRPADWPATRYEQKALRAGRKPAYLSFERTPRGPGA